MSDDDDEHVRKDHEGLERERATSLSPSSVLALARSPSPILPSRSFLSLFFFFTSRGFSHSFPSSSFFSLSRVPLYFPLALSIPPPFSVLLSTH